MREDYYKLIREKSIQDTLSWVEQMSYSKKLEIINDLLTKYPVEAVNSALYNYEVKYIRIHRVIPYLIKNILIGLCKDYIKKNGEKVK